MIMISVVVTSLIVNIHLFGRINQLNDEISELQVQIRDFQQIQDSQYIEFEEINRNPQYYDGVRVVLVGYLIRSENPVIQYYLTPDFSIINDLPSTKMVILAGDIGSLQTKFNLESYLTFVADFPRNEITQIDCKKVILFGRVNHLEISLAIYIGNGSRREGWCIIPEFILPLSTCVLD